jgi:hypothetical protein
MGVVGQLVLASQTLGLQTHTREVRVFTGLLVTQLIR